MPSMLVQSSEDNTLKYFSQKIEFDIFYGANLHEISNPIFLEKKVIIFSPLYLPSKCYSLKKYMYITDELQWLEHLWGHANLFKIWVVQAT